MVSVRTLSWVAVVVTSTSCNVAPPPASTGGVAFSDAGMAAVPMLEASAGDETMEAGTTQRTCGRGTIIMESDHKSTNIVVSGLDGVTLSSSFVSSGATKPGLALALSGDVDVPYTAPASHRAVIIDRYGTNVITWMNVDTADVVAQLPVGQGFEANPHDYIEVDRSRAFVSRYGSNISPGLQPFDGGGDLLILDLTAFSITGRIAVPEEDPRLLPCPSEMTWLGHEVVVTLGRWSRDFSNVGEGRFLGVSPETSTVTWTANVTGLDACGRLAVSPDERHAAIACSARYDFDTKRYDTARSDIVLFDAAQRPPTEVRRFGLGAKLNSGIQPTLVFASDNLLVGTAYGGNGTPGDQAFALDISSGQVSPLLTNSKAFVLGGLRCSPGCGDVCLLCDAEINRLRRWHLGSAGLEPLEPTVLESIVGLPPRTMGGL